MEVGMRAGTVLICGAGPVGMTLALALKRRGVDVRIVDTAPARTDKSKALVLWPRTLELLDIQGGVDRFVAAGMPARGARILADGKPLASVDFHTARSIYRYALMIPQSETERLLEERLESLGLSVERGTSLASFEDDGAGVTALLTRPDGRQEHVRADWLAGCDGAHSTVRHGLGAAVFEGDTLPSEWVLADLQIDGDLPRDEITICWTHDGVMVFFPIAGARFRVIADTEPAEGSGAATPTLEQVQALVDRRGPAGLALRDPAWLSRFHINERKVRDYRHGRVFLAGDAAHVHSPAGGQGMNTGMQDALNLAWKLALVWHGDAAPALLDSYSPERSAIGAQVLRNAGILTQVAITANPILRQLRALAAGALNHLPALRQRLVDELTEVDLDYAHGPLTSSPHGAARHPASGARAPDVALAAGGPFDRLHAALATGRFAALSVGAPAIDLPPALARLATAVHADAATAYDAGHVYLIRPDAYVALSVSPDDTGALIAMLEGLAA
jgi:2-polyprenyl-6-methoxyphenol hydroxylase-like FAD-dependent oxidoreductase